MPHDLPGTLIVVEGIDGAGKSSLITRLHALLSTHYSVITTKEPGGSVLGAHLRTLLQHQPFPIAPRAEYLLFAADRAHHFQDVVIPALTRGDIVISDRMSDSSIAYQGYGRGHDKEIIQTINAWTMHGISPDITLYLRIPVDVAYDRIHNRQENLTVFEQEKRSFMERVAHGFDTIYQDRKDVLIMDALHGQEKLAQDAYAHIMQWLNMHKK